MKDVLRQDWANWESWEFFQARNLKFPESEPRALAYPTLV